MVRERHYPRVFCCRHSTSFRYRRFSRLLTKIRAAGAPLTASGNGCARIWFTVPCSGNESLPGRNGNSFQKENRAKVDFRVREKSG